MTPYYDSTTEELKIKIAELDQAVENIGYLWEEVFDVAYNFKEQLKMKKLSAEGLEPIEKLGAAVNEHAQEFIQISEGIKKLIVVK